MNVEDGSSRIKRHDIATDELLGASPAGYWDFEYPGGVFVARTVDRRIFQLDPTSLRPIGARFPGIAELNGMTRLGDDASRVLESLTPTHTGPTSSHPEPPLPQARARVCVADLSRPSSALGARPRPRR